MHDLWHEDAPGSKHAQEHWARVRDEVVEQLIRALPQKGLQARALCVDALLSFGGQLSPEQAARVAREVPAVLPVLPAARLDELLRYRFVPIEKLPLAEPLGKVLGRADLTPDVRQIALKRWLSISPKSA